MKSMVVAFTAIIFFPAECDYEKTIYMNYINTYLEDSNHEVLRRVLN